MGGTAVLNMNDEFNLFGQKAYISGRVFETFPPIPDAPTEKELVIEQAEEEGSLFGNFAFGALVTASLGALTYVAFGAAFAAATVATGGALLVVGACLAGATAAAATVTVAATVTDYQSGHVRTADEFASQLAAGTALGAVTGATLYGLWYAIPGASILMGADLAGLFASSSPVAAVAFSKAAALAGYFLMGSQVIRYASEISSLGTGYNWMLEQLFGGDAVTYSDATTLMDALAAYTVIVGWENMPEKLKESRENLIKYGKMDTSLIGEGAGQSDTGQDSGGFLPEEYYSGEYTSKPTLIRDEAGNVKLYRTVSEAEYKSLMKEEPFSTVDGAMESKWLSTTIDDANQWGRAMNFGGEYKIVEITVPESILDDMYYGGPNLDNIGPAYNASSDLLNSFLDTIKSVN